MAARTAAAPQDQSSTRKTEDKAVGTAAMIDPSIPAELREAVITRTFDAPRQLVWDAWTQPKHLSQWWGPHGFDAVHPSVDPRPGGKMNLDMRTPDGGVMPNQSVVRESRPPEKLVFASSAFFDKNGVPSFKVVNTVTLMEHAGKTTMTLKVEVVKAGAQMIEGLRGMNIGWGEAFQKMAEHLDLVGWGAFESGGKTSFTLPAARPVAVVRRTFDAPRDLVWRALVDPEMRVQWWGPAKYRTKVHVFDVRPGGKWHIDHIGRDGGVFAFSGEFTEVRKPMRLVNTFNCEGLPPTVETTTLSETNGKTTLTNVGVFDSVAGRRAWVEPGMESGARESMERLAVLLDA